MTCNQLHVGHVEQYQVAAAGKLQLVTGVTISRRGAPHPSCERASERAKREAARRRQKQPAHAINHQP